MKTILTPILVIFGAAVLSFSCKKSNTAPALPPATQNGSDAMGGYIDNVAWYPQISFHYTGIISDYSGAAFRVLGYSDNADHTVTTSVYIDLRNFTGTGTYALNSALLPVATANSGQVRIEHGGYTAGQAPVTPEYDTDSLHVGSITITHFDPVKKIVSGTFQFNALNQKNSSDVIHVTDGRFDVVCPLTIN